MPKRNAVGSPPSQLIAAVHGADAAAAQANAKEKVWITIEGGADSSATARVERGITTTELRKVVKTRTGVPIREMELVVGGKVLAEGFAQPLLCVSEEDLVVKWNQSDRLQSLMNLRKLDTINSVSSWERGLLHYTVIDGDPDMCLDLTKRDDWDDRLLNLPDIFRDTPLILASILGYSEIVEMLIDRQADVNAQNLQGRTPLQLASEHGYHEVCKALLQQNAEYEAVPVCSGMMGFSTNPKFPTTKHLAKLNDRSAVLYRLRMHKLAKKDEAKAELANK